MDNVTQIIPAGTWQAQLPRPTGEDGWRDVPLVGWALVHSDAGARVVGLILEEDARHVTLIDEDADAFGGYQPARLGERERQQVEDGKGGTDARPSR